MNEGGVCASVSIKFSPFDLYPEITSPLPTSLAALNPDIALNRDPSRLWTKFELLLVWSVWRMCLLVDQQESVAI